MGSSAPARGSRSTCWSSAPASPASTSCTARGKRGSRWRCSRPAAAWAAPGTGTATPARGSTPRATPTPTSSPGNCSTNGSGRSTSPSSPRPSATSTTWSTGSTCAATSEFDAKVTSAEYDESSGTWTVAVDRRPRVPHAVLRRRDRRPLGAVLPGRTRTRRLPRRVVPHRVVAGHAGRLRGQARRGHRDRVERRAADPFDRGRGRLADRVPTQRQLVHAAQQRADHAHRASPTARRLRSDARDAEHVARRVPPPGARPRHVRRLRSRAPGVLREDVEQPRLLEAQQPLHRLAVRYRRERRVVRVHRREDPEHRQGSRHRREADPEGPPLRREAAAVRHRVLRGVQPAERVARRPRADADRAHDRARHRDGRRCAGVRHRRVGDRLRLRHRRAHAHGHPRPERPRARRRVGGRTEDVPRCADAPASRTSSSPAGRTRPPATTRATTAIRSTSSPTRSSTCATTATTRSKSTPPPKRRWTDMVDTVAAIPPSFGKSSYFFGSNIPGKPRQVPPQRRRPAEALQGDRKSARHRLRSVPPVAFVRRRGTTA